jgi:hypothetical protein
VASGPPTLRVARVAAISPRYLAVTLQARAPGIKLRPGAGGYDSPFDEFFSEQHALDDSSGEGRGILDLFTFPLRHVRLAGGGDFGDDGHGCLLLEVDHIPATLSYRLHYTWNHYLGATSILRTGHITVHRRPNASDTGCVG